jgi:general secretion pathway protein A
MYREFYRLKEAPFQLLPDPRFFLFSEKARGAFDQLRYGIKSGLGFMMLTGEVGVGKTSLLRVLLQNLDHSVDRALVLNPMLRNSEELIKCILLDLGARRHFPQAAGQGGSPPHPGAIPPGSAQARQEGPAHHRRGADPAGSAPRGGETPFNFETNDEKLLQILLVGQPELRRRIDSPEFRQLHQRIAVKALLSPPWTRGRWGHT